MDEDINKEEFDLRGVKFTVGIMCHGMMPPITALSFIDSFRTLVASGINMNYVAQLNCSIVDCARNNIARDFLEESKGDKLVFIDSDMQWTPEDLVRLMCWSTKYPIVGALYSSKTDLNPSYFGMYNVDDGQVMENEYGLVKMDAIPTGFCIIDRQVFLDMKPHTEKYKEKDGKIRHRFFKTTTEQGDFVGEDIYFFNRWVKEFGGEIWVDPDINPGHIGPKVYKGNVRDALVKFNETLAVNSAKVNSEKEI